jgi:hypothetical protein
MGYDKLSFVSLFVDPTPEGLERRFPRWGRRLGMTAEMGFREKARIRIEHWLEHNESHRKEYERFAAELEEARASGSAAAIREMAALTRQTGACLRQALAALEDRVP